MPRIGMSITTAGLIGLAIVATASGQESPVLGTEAPAGAEPASPPVDSESVESSTSTDQESQSDPAGGSVSGQIQTDATEGGLGVSSQQSAFLRASSFIGVPVQGMGDARLGTVGDILIDPRTYEMRYVLIDTGPGVGTNGFPIIPWTLFHLPGRGAVNAGVLTVPLSIERLSQAPVTTLGANDLLRRSAWIDQVDRFYATDLSERRISRPELDAEGAAQSRNLSGAQSAPGVSSRREDNRVGPPLQRQPGRAGAGALRNPARLRNGAAGTTPGATDNAERNRGPASRTPGATDNAARNRGPGSTTPGSVDSSRNRGPATGSTRGATDNAGRNRGPTAPSTGTGTSNSAGAGTTGGTSSGSGNPGAN